MILMTFRSDMVVMIALILFVILLAGSISSNLKDAFNDPYWMKDNEE